MARSRMDRVAWGKALQRNQLPQTEMTNLVSDALTNATPVAEPLTNTLNALTSASSARLHAVEDRVPGTVVLLLFVFALVTTMRADSRRASVGPLRSRNSSEF
jgi:hypothetical protein